MEWWQNVMRECIYRDNAARTLTLKELSRIRSVAECLDRRAFGNDPKAKRLADLAAETYDQKLADVATIRAKVSREIKEETGQLVNPSNRYLYSTPVGEIGVFVRNDRTRALRLISRYQYEFSNHMSQRRAPALTPSG